MSVLARPMELEGRKHTIALVATSGVSQECDGPAAVNMQYADHANTRPSRVGRVCQLFLPPPVGPRAFLEVEFAGTVVGLS